MLRPLEYTRTGADESRGSTALEENMQPIMLACAALCNEQNRQNTLFLVLVIVGIAGTVALFSTAFSTCTKISLENKTSELVYIYGVGPYKTKVSSREFLPYTTTTITLNGYNSYADLYTTAGQMHFSHFGKQGKLKNGANNKGLEVGNPPIFFWVCNQNYVKVTASSDNQTEALSLNREAPRLRGSLFSFYASSRDKEKSEQSEIDLLTAPLSLT